MPALFFVLWGFSLVATGASLWSLRAIPYCSGIVETRWYLACLMWMVFFDGLSSMPFAATWKIAFYMAIHVGAVPIPAFWVVFALRFSRLVDSLARKWVAVLAIVPALTLLQVLTNPWHHLFWTKMDVSSEGLLLFENGPGYFLWYAYSWLGWLALAVILLNMALFYQGNRLQARILVLAALVPWFVELMLLVMGHLHTPGYNFLPILTGLASFFLLFAIRRAQFLQSDWIAPHMVFNADQVIVRNARRVPERFVDSPQDEQSDLQRRLLSLFEKEKIYLDPKLDMNQVCRLLCTNRKNISNLVNGTFGISFPRFINRYRIREYERLLEIQAKLDAPQMTVDALAAASGFSSRSRFYEVLKEFQAHG